MRRGDHDLEKPQLVRLHIDGAVHADVGLDALEQAEPVLDTSSLSRSISRCCSASRAIDTPPAIGSPYE